MNKKRILFNLFSVRLQWSTQYILFNLEIFNIGWNSWDTSLLEFYMDEEQSIWAVEILFSSLIIKLLEDRWQK